MASIGRILIMLFKGASYLSLCLLTVALLGFVGVFAFDLCGQAGKGQIRCDGPVYRAIFEFGFLTLMMSVHLVVPALLGVCGLILVLRRVWIRIGLRFRSTNSRAASDPGQST